MDVRYWQWSAGAQLMRLPSMMAPLAYSILAVGVTGSYRFGGLMMAVFTVAALVAAGPVGRMLDRDHRPMSESGAPPCCPSGHSDTVKLLSMAGLAGSSAAPSGGGCCGGGCCS